MTATVIKELIKTYFIMVSLFGTQETHRLIIKHLPDEPPKMMSLSKFSKQLTGVK